MTPTTDGGTPNASAGFTGASVGTAAVAAVLQMPPDSDYRTLFLLAVPFGSVLLSQGVTYARLRVGRVLAMREAKYVERLIKNQLKDPHVDEATKDFLRGELRKVKQIILDQGFDRIRILGQAAEPAPASPLEAKPLQAAEPAQEAPQSS